jgi:hypothetical protein
MLEILCEKGLPGERGERKSLTKADIRKISYELLTFIDWVEAPYLSRDRVNISFAFFHVRHPCLDDNLKMIVRSFVNFATNKKLNATISIEHIGSCVILSSCHILNFFKKKT